MQDTKDPIGNPKSETRTRKGIGGPKTEEGKRKSSLNAMKHGLTARSPQAQEKIDQKIGVSYQEILDRMVDYYQPADPLEEELVRRIARCVWRLAQTEIMEGSMSEFNRGTVAPRVCYFEILRFERLVDIHLHRAIRVLMQKRALEDIKSNKTNSLSPSARA